MPHDVNDLSDKLQILFVGKRLSKQELNERLKHVLSVSRKRVRNAIDELQKWHPSLKALRNGVIPYLYHLR